MLIKTEELKKITDNILPAVDTSVVTNITENLELYVQNQSLYICVTNREYYVKSVLPIGYDEELHATVNATLFLKLISQITTEDIELKTDNKTLYIKGNGNYKLPLIFEDEDLLVLPKIDIDNPTCSMKISTAILNSIARYNSKELQCGIISRPVQKMYYIDEEGAITFTNGACVNKFTLEKPVKMLLNGKIVKLFKLFTDQDVEFTLGYDALSETIIQTKIMFKDSKTELTAILSCDDTMLRSVPVKNIRGRAFNPYPYEVVVNKNSMIQSINRLSLLMNRGAKDAYQFVAKFNFTQDGVTISDDKEENVEFIGFSNKCEALNSGYSAMFNLSDIKNTLSVCDEDELTMHFGDNLALVISRTNIFNVIPEYHD